MWQALRKRKLQLAPGHDSREDGITSTIGSRLAYLPETVWSSLLSALYSEPIHPGPLERVDFWPRWRHPDTGQVEPDMNYEFERLRLIVEVKREGGEQTRRQLSRELDAAGNHLADGKATRILALGGSLAGVPRQLPARAVSWRDFAALVRIATETAPDCPAPLSSDLDQAFAWFGFPGWAWLSDTEIAGFRPDPAGRSVSLLTDLGEASSRWWLEPGLLPIRDQWEVFEQ